MPGREELKNCISAWEAFATPIAKNKMPKSFSEKLEKKTTLCDQCTQRNNSANATAQNKSNLNFLHFVLSN